MAGRYQNLSIDSLDDAFTAFLKSKARLTYFIILSQEPILLKLLISIYLSEFIDDFTRGNGSERIV